MGVPSIQPRATVQTSSSELCKCWRMPARDGRLEGILGKRSSNTDVSRRAHLAEIPVLFGTCGRGSQLRFQTFDKASIAGSRRSLPNKTEFTMAMQEKGLSDAFYETLKDVYFAERQILKALKKSARAAQAPELKKAFETHATETATHVERLTEVFGLIGKTARSKTCEATQGILAEMEEDLEEFGETEAADAVLIASAQAIEHYEIARYGTLKAWAADLELAEAEKLLGETLDEERRTDALLSEIAERDSNLKSHRAA